MAGVSAAEQGLKFVWACFTTYWGSCLFPLLFAAGMIWTLIRHRSRTPIVLAVYTASLCLTVYNPLLANIAVSKLHLENEYYRFFWLLPVIPGVAYYAVLLVFGRKARWQRLLMAAAAAVMIIRCGVPIEGVTVHFSAAENLYKVPSYFMDLCEDIHEDSGRRTSRVALPYELIVIARQYDASLRLVIPRDIALFRMGSAVIHVNEEGNYYQTRKPIMDLLFFDEEVPAEELKEALTKAKSRYIVVDSSYNANELLREAGAVEVAQEWKYTLYRFDYDAEEASGESLSEAVTEASEEDESEAATEEAG